MSQIGKCYLYTGRAIVFLITTTIAKKPDNYLMKKKNFIARFTSFPTIYNYGFQEKQRKNLSERF